MAAPLGDGDGEGEVPGRVGVRRGEVVVWPSLAAPPEGWRFLPGKTTATSHLAAIVALQDQDEWPRVSEVYLARIEQQPDEQGRRLRAAESADEGARVGKRERERERAEVTDEVRRWRSECVQMTRNAEDRVSGAELERSFESWLMVVDRERPRGSMAMLRAVLSEQVIEAGAAFDQRRKRYVGMRLK